MSCSSDDQSDKDCPLCMEAFEIDDLNFFPCKCGYQICQFCWHRLRTIENGLCPACRQPYPDDPVNFKPVSTADMQRLKDEKRMKRQAERMRISEERKHLANYRVLQKNLVYVVGLSQRVAVEDVLKRPEYFGRFGKILKVVTGTTPPAPHLHIQPSCTAYVTYSRIDEALRAIQAVNNAQLDGRVVKASLGTTKYCSSFLRSQICGKPECMYLHDIADNDISFTKDDMHMGKHAEYEKRLIEALMRRLAMEKEQRRQQISAKNTNWETNSRDIQDEETSVYTNDNDTDWNDDSERSKDSEENIMASDLQENDNAASSTVSESKRVDEPETEASLESSSPDNAMSQPEVEVSDSSETEQVPVEPCAPTAVLQTSLPQSESKLLRLMRASEDSGRGCIPAPAPMVEAPAPLTNWQTLLGLSSPGSAEKPYQSIPNGTVHSPPPGFCGQSDDDLGFDPFNESVKGLAMLLEEERTTHASPFESLFSSTPLTCNGGSLRDLWRSAPAPAPSQHPTQNLLSFGHADPFASAFSKMAPPTSMYNGHEHNGYHTHHAPPGLTPVRQPSSAPQPQSMHEWQEGLKALLPHVNVRFSNEMEQQMHHHHHQQQQQPRWYGAESQMSHAMPPPPGFGVPNR